MASFSRPGSSGASPLTVKIESTPAGVIVQPVGDVDLAASPLLRNELRTAQLPKPAKLVIDLAQVPYMDSSGLATLLEAMRTSQRNNTKLVLCSLQPRVKSIFEIARLDTVFTIALTREDAVK